MILYHIKEVECKFFILYCNYFINIFLDIWKYIGSGCSYGCTVSYGLNLLKAGDLSCLKRSLHTGCSCRFYTYYLYIRMKHFRKGRNSCTETASTDWNKDVVHSWKLLKDFHCYSTLSCSNYLIIKGMYKGHPIFFGKFKSIGTGLVIDITI